MKFIKSKPFSAAVKITAVLIADWFLRKAIFQSELLHIYTQDFIQKYYDYQTLSLYEWFCITWNQNINLLVIDLTKIIIIILFFRFRFTKAENFRFSRHTTVIALSCLAVSIIGYSYLMYYSFLHGTLSWQMRITEFLQTVFVVALLEEFAYRGFIANILFRLKPSGLKTPVAIVVSAAVFAFAHIQGLLSLLLGLVPATMNFEAMLFNSAREFLEIAAIGLPLAIILYYKKDIVSVICIHAANNLLFESYRSGGKAMLIGALYVAFCAIYCIIYPAVLIFKAWRKQKVLTVE